jgi:hypothetical protein
LTARIEIDKAALFADIGYEPHPGQQVVHASRARRRVCAMGSRFGKTTLAAFECVAYALTPRERAVGWIVAPNYELSTRVFREVVHVFLTKLRELVIVHRDHEHLLRVYNIAGGVCEIRGKSADSPVSLLGEGLDFLVCDEFARFKPEVWERYLAQRLIDKDGDALFTSTPKGKGLYYALFKRGQPGPDKDPDYESWNLPSWTNPLLNRALIEAERERIPEAAFRQEFGGEFIEGSGSVFRNVRDLATGEFHDPDPDETYIAGLDLARVHDYTVLVILDEQRRVVFLDRFTRVDWTVQVGRIRTALERYNDAMVLVDSTGAGEPIYETLLEAGCRVDPYTFTQASKAALINNLALMLEKREIELPTVQIAPELIDELEAFQYSVTDSGTVRSGAPSGWHDDCVISLALGAWACREPGDYQVQFV